MRHFFQTSYLQIFPINYFHFISLFFAYVKIIIIMSYRQHGYPTLTTFPYRSSPLAGLQGYIPYPHIAVLAGRPALVRPYVGDHRSTSLMSSSLLLHQCPACLVRLTWIVFVMGGGWPYSRSLVGCCHQDLSNLNKNKK